MLIIRRIMFTDCLRNIFGRPPYTDEIAQAETNPQLFWRARDKSLSLAEKLNLSAREVFRACAIIAIKEPQYKFLAYLDPDKTVYIKKRDFKLPFPIIIYLHDKGFDPYLCLSKMILGDGSAKNVYLGIDLNREMPVAIADYKKADRTFWLCEREFHIQRLFGEAIAKTVYSGKNGRMRFKAVMPLANGGDLHTLTLKNPDLHPIYRKQILDSLLLCVNYFHQCGVILADIKPENILLDFAGGTFRARFNDLGLSILAGHDKAHTHTTDRYAAPEQRGLNEAPVSTKTDVFQTALALWLAFVDSWGSMGFSVVEDYEAFWKEKKKQYPAESLEADLLDMMHPDPAERPSIAEVIRKGLHLKIS